MTKSERSRGFAIVLVIAVLTAAVAMNEEARTATRQWNASGWDYYTRLENRCEDECCRASVDAMRQVQAEVQPQTGCPAGDSAEMLRCQSSYRWCEDPGQAASR